MAEKPVVVADPEPTAAEMNAATLSALQAIAANQPRRKLKAHEIVFTTPWWDGTTPKAKLTREFYQNGNPVFDHVLSNDEIELINKLKPGLYVKKKFRVTLMPGGAIGLWYDNKTLGQRFDIAKLAGDKQGLVNILQMILLEEESQKARRKQGLDPYDE